jgi:predicted lipoprotein with Yx(FWY)xxD motif
MKTSIKANIRSFSRSAHRRVAVVALACSGLVAACVDEEPGISSSEGAAGDSANAEAGAGAEATSTAGKPGSSTGGSAAAQGGSPGEAGANEGGGAPLPPVGAGGDSGRGGAPPDSEEGGAGGATEPPVPMSCVFHTAAPETDPAEGGAGPASPAANILVAQSPFIGAYLTDAAGRTLYTFGSDLPGDCETAPVSRCVTLDCLDSWPIFSGGDRVLGPGLDDAAFGTVTHSNGTPQVTYHGWPLYYYKLDLSLGQLTGQGKAKTWHVAEVSPPSVVIMKSGTVKYLADGAGRTLYVSANDTVGSLLDPISRCQGACLEEFTPFRDNRLSVVSSLEPQDFSTFLRLGGGGLQLAYKGLPLYLATADAHAGDMHGTETAGFSAALP